MIDRIMMGTYLAKKRRDLGMTQSELSTRLHVSFQAVSKWERGLSLPDDEMLKKTYKVLGINEGLHIFEMASSMSLRDLIEDVIKLVKIRVIKNAITPMTKPLIIPVRISR